MPELPEISDEMVDAAALVLREAVKRHGAFIGTETAERWARDILTAALVASGWRPEADVLRESGSRWLDMTADANWLKTWLSAHGLGVDAGPATVLTAVGRDLLAYSTKFGPLDPAQPLPVAAPRSNAVELIAAERQRQITAEGWTPEHDAQHSCDQIAVAAACYALPPSERKCHPRLAGGHGDDRGDRYVPVPILWPWRADDWKPKPDDRVRELVKAGALIAAEIDRLATQPLPVAAVEGQERSEGPVMVPCECPDPRCTNRVAILLVGDEDPGDESSRG